MKKILVLLTVMVMVFGITAAAYSADVCSSCTGTIRDIPCVPPVQGGATCNGFDYDLNSALDGYCVFSAKNNHRLIFSICNCAKAASFVPGLHVAVKMTILVNNMDGDRGAYWSSIPGGAPATINFKDYATAALACDNAPLTKTFGAPTYYLSDGSITGTPSATNACTVTGTNKVTILRTAAPGYVLVAGDAPHWRIDVPPIRIDPAVVPAGAKISVKVELYDPTVQTTICPTCVECLCDCTIDVAITCCSVATSTTLNFPYFADLKSTLGWWNGIAINNTTAAAGSCTLTAVEKTGAISTATVAVPAGGMFVSFLENLTFAGATGGLPARITAVCNYAGATGFAMMADRSTSDSMGYKVP